MLSGVPLLDAKIGPDVGRRGFVAVVRKSAILRFSSSRVSGALASSYARSAFAASLADLVASACATRILWASSMRTNGRMTGTGAFDFLVFGRVTCPSQTLCVI